MGNISLPSGSDTSYLTAHCHAVSKHNGAAGSTTGCAEICAIGATLSLLDGTVIWSGQHAAEGTNNQAAMQAAYLAAIAAQHLKANVLEIHTKNELVATSLNDAASPTASGRPCCCRTGRLTSE